MSLFQKSVERKYLNELDSTFIDSKYSAFREYFNNQEIQQNIRNSKEEQFQEGFLRELFVNIFGYTLNPHPEFNLTTELKNIANSKKVDGAILKNGDAIAVIELKGTDTSDLDKVESQAFGYKSHNPKCIYVITSNFEKIRFYIQNAVEHINFNLFDMSREQFTLMWLCLAKVNLLNDIPLKMKESSLMQEENITKKLYADYSKFREAIYNNLVKNNIDNDAINKGLQHFAPIDKLLLFKKTQKLLDRFLFVFFAEDRLLIPPNSIREIINQWKILKEELDEYMPLYARFKKFFGYLNTGFKGKNYEIFAYNGGLFAPDEILDNITIDDNILFEHTVKLSQYDFDTEVDVNILGHIFEHSLGEIESVQAEIKGETVETQKSKRKKDGIFYTPKYITKYIVENTVGKLCIEKRAEFGIIDEEYAKGRKNRKKEEILALDKKLTDYRNWLLNITILDPACGSGAFLNQALDFLIVEHRKIDHLRAALFEEGLVFADITSDILENNIYGVDINEESVEIAKLSLWLRTAQIGRKLNSLSNNIKCGNSLIDDAEVAGDKAFNWEKEFPEIMSNGGFDVVIGNPPWGAEITNIEKFYLRNKYLKSTIGKIDSYRIFIEKSFSLAKKNGLISIIVPNTFMYNVQSLDLRKLILTSVSIYDAVELRKNIFDDAPDVVPVIISLINNSNIIEQFRCRVAYHNFKYNDINNSNWLIDQMILIPSLKKDKDFKINLRSNTTFNTINQKLLNYNKVGDFFNLRQGTKPFGSKDGKEFELITKYKADENWEKAINGRNISRYFIEFEGDYVHRCDKIHSIIDKSIIYSEKIYFQRMRKISLFPRIVASYDSENIHGLYTCSIIYKKDNILDLKYLLCILNSKLINIWYKYFDTDIEIKLISVKQIPIANISHEAQIPFIALADKMLEMNKELKEKENKFIELLKADFNIEKPSTKLENWTKLNWAEFEKELKKAKITLSGEKKEDWFERFNRFQSQTSAIKSEIDHTDKKIDQLVYQLYELTEDEIKIVEGE